MSWLSLGCVLLAFLSQPPADPPEYTAAVRLVQQQRWSEALDRIGALLERYPGNLKAGNLKGLALLGAGRSTDAIAAFHDVVARQPGFFPAWKNLALAEWTAGRPEAARDTAAALKFVPADPVLNAYAALAAMERNSISEAAAHLDRAAVSALTPELELRLGILLGRHGLHARAASTFDDLLRRGYDGPNLRYNLALAHYLAKDYAAAIRVLEAARPSSESLNLLAQAYNQSGQSQKAIDTLRQATALAPADENNYLDLAALCIDHGAYPLGIEVVQIGLQHRPGSAKLLVELGVLHALSGDFDRAQAEFEQAARHEPSSSLPAAGIELAAIQQSRLPDAVRDLRLKVKENSRSPVLWYLLGSALVRSGVDAGSPAFSEAQDAFRNAMRLDPKLPYPYVELGKLYMRQQRVSEAVPLFEKATRLAPRDRAAFYQLALAYRRLNQPERARQMLARVSQLNEADRENAFRQEALVKH